MGEDQPRLKRELGVWHATGLGLGSIVGTGVFVSIGVATGIAGPAVLVALVLGALVALCNGLSSAQLAASHPVSGGTYEYGYRYIGPLTGFTAGWLFLLAKSASAATAALGFSGYLLNAAGLVGHPALVPLALGGLIVVMALVLIGVRRSAQVNFVIVGFTLVALSAFVIGGLPTALSEGAANLTPFFDAEEGRSPLTAVLHASALMFVAYTGYGRIATLGEEVVAPRRTIPRAVVLTLAITLVLYVSVAWVGVAAVGSATIGQATDEAAAPLEVAARAFSPTVARVVSIGAVTAMLGVLLNLILGLSRVLLAMGRRGDMPAAVARLSGRQSTPYASVFVVTAIIAILVLTGDVRTTWSFSAMTVLLYYAVTNVAALRLPESDRRYPRWVAWAGLVSCIGLSVFIDPPILLVGVILIGAGIAWHYIAQRLQRAS